MRKSLMLMTLFSFGFAVTAGCASKKKQMKKERQAKKEAKEARQQAEAKEDAAKRAAQADIQELQSRVERLESELEQSRELAADRKNLHDALRSELSGLMDRGDVKLTERRGLLVVQIPRDVLFAPSKFKLTDRGKETLRSIASSLDDVEKHRILVAGHTDNVPVSKKSVSFEDNWELSSMRALSSTELLVNSGVSQDHLAAAGFGSSDPIASNDTEASRAKNRRVELMLVPDLNEIIKGANERASIE